MSNNNTKQSDIIPPIPPQPHIHNISDPISTLIAVISALAIFCIWGLWPEEEKIAIPTNHLIGYKQIENNHAQ